MVLGDGIRYNVATLPPEEQLRFRDAFIKAHREYLFPDGVSGWFKQDHIHQATHVHGGAQFLPWHRELCNRFEEILRKVDPEISLHYWRYDNTNPIQSKLLGPDGLFGASHDIVGPPLDILHNRGILKGSRDEDPAHPNPALPPKEIVRDVRQRFPFCPPDEAIITYADDEDIQYQWQLFREELEFSSHGPAHNYIAGTLATPHDSFTDILALILHSNVDRIWASWQLQPGKEWRLDPEKIYGAEHNESELNVAMEPWAGGTVRPEQKIRPWGIDWPAEMKTAKDVVKPPRYQEIVIVK